MAPWKAASALRQGRPASTSISSRSQRREISRRWLGVGVDCRLAHHVVFERAADFDQPQQRLAFEPDHGGHEAMRGLDAGGEVGAVAAAAPDDAEAFPAVERLADGRAADAERRWRARLRAAGGRRS